MRKIRKFSRLLCVLVTATACVTSSVEFALSTETIYGKFNQIIFTSNGFSAENRSRFGGDLLHIRCFAIVCIGIVVTDVKHITQSHST